MDNIFTKFLRLTITVFIFSLLFMFLQLISNTPVDIFSIDGLDAHAGTEDDDDDDEDDDGEGGEVTVVVTVMGENSDIKMPQGDCEAGVTCVTEFGIRGTPSIVPARAIFGFTTLIITAVPLPGFVFDRWEGDHECNGATNPTLEIFLNRDITCIGIAVLADSQEIPADISGGGEDSELLVLITPTVVTPPEGKASETVAQEAEALQNVEVVINLPEEVIVNSASINGDEGACEIVNDMQVLCTIEELTEETEILLELSVPDLGGEILPVQVLLTTDSFPGETLEQFLNLTAGAAGTGSSSGCTIAPAGGGNALLILFALLPAIFLFRKLRKK